MAFSRDQAETFALTALGWLAGHDELLPVFLGATGASLSDVKTRAGDADFLGSVLDFVMMDDAWVIEMCDALAVPYETVQTARAGLPGPREWSNNT